MTVDVTPLITKDEKKTLLDILTKLVSQIDKAMEFHSFSGAEDHYQKEIFQLQPFNAFLEQCNDNSMQVLSAQLTLIPKLAG